MAKDEVPVEDAEIVEVPPEKPSQTVTQAQLSQTAISIRPHSAPVQIPKSYDELFMRQINRWWDYYIKFGWMHEWSPWERRRFIKIGEGLLWYVSSMDADRSIGDAIWDEYKEQRRAHRVEDTELVEKLARLIFYELTARGKTGTQATTARNRISESKLALRFNAMFGAAGVESYHELGLGDVVAMMQQDIADDYDVLVLICAKEGDLHGGKGMGKSDVAQVLAAMLDPTFDTRHKTVFGEDVARMRHLMNSKKHGIAWVIDELDRFVNKQRTMTKPVQEISSDFIARRYLNQYVIGCVPQVWYAATKFLDNVTYLVRVLQRGTVEIYRGNERDEPAKEWKGQQVGGPGHKMEIPRLPKDARLVYDRCKAYADDHPPGALDTLLKNKPGWPRHVEIAEPAEAPDAPGEPPVEEVLKVLEALDRATEDPEDPSAGETNEVNRVRRS